MDQMPVKVECTNELQIFLHFHVVWDPDLRTEVGVSGLSNKWDNAKIPTPTADHKGPFVSLSTLAILTYAPLRNFTKCSKCRMTNV